MASKKKSRPKDKRKRTKRTNPTASAAKIAEKLQAKSPIGTSLVSYNGGLSTSIRGKISATQLELFEGLSYKEAAQELIKVAQVRDGGNWWVGDALNYMESHFGEEYAQAAHDAGVPEDTLSILQSVSARVAPENRFKELSWSHHRVVARMEAEDQLEWLKKAIKNNWSVRELMAAIKGPEEESEEGDGDTKSTHCETCAAVNAKQRVCGKCMALVVSAMENGGIEAAKELIKRKPTNPQLDNLRWAFDNIKEPEHFTDNGEKEWKARYDAMAAMIKKMEAKELKKAA